MIELFFPNHRALLPTFHTNCPYGSHFAHIGSHLAQNTTPNPCSFLSIHNPFLGYVSTQNTPNPTPENPFSWPELRNYSLGNLDPTVQYLKSGQSFSRRKKKKMFTGIWFQLWHGSLHQSLSQGNHYLAGGCKINYIPLARLKDCWSALAVCTVLRWASIEKRVLRGHGRITKADTHRLIIGIARFPVDSEYKFWESNWAQCLNIQIKEIHTVKLMLENFGWIYDICYRLCALPFKIYICISVSKSCTDFA